MVNVSWNMYRRFAQVSYLSFKMWSPPPVWLSLVVYDTGVLRAKLVLSSHKGDGTLFHAEVETLRVIGSDTPYRGVVILRIIE